MKTAELSHGAIRRGPRVVLHAASITLPATGTVGVIGVNGAGKSTLFHALADTLRRGHASLRVHTWSREETVAFAPQEPAFPAWLDVADAVRLHGHELSEVLHRTPGLLLEEIARHQVRALSAGQRQALAVGLALAADATVTLLDEPSAFLDFRRRFGLGRLLRARRAPAGKGLVLISSQSAADLLDACDWLLVLREGRYVYSGAADALTAGIADPAKARQRFEEAVMGLLGAALPEYRGAGRSLRMAPAAGT